MASKSSILRQYDRLAAVAVLILLLASLGYLLLKGLGRQQEVKEYDDTLGMQQPTKAQCVPVDLTADEALLTRNADPAAAKLLLQQAPAGQADLFSLERRLLCVKCGYPIPFEASVCPFPACKAVQPKEKKIDLSTIDSDGDGLPDLWERKYGFDPQNEKDADEDADGDGFSNIEEYEAKTDPKDPASHPGYETRIGLVDISGTKVPLRAINKMKLPATPDHPNRHRVTFVQVDPDGRVGKVSLFAADGEEIKKDDALNPVKTGFRFVRYNELPTRQIKPDPKKGGLPKFVNVSTITLERVSDKKQIDIVFWDPNNPEWPGEPLLELQATVSIDLPGAENVTVANGGTFKVKGETFKIRSIDPEKKIVKVEKVATKAIFDLK